MENLDKNPDLMKGIRAAALAGAVAMSPGVGQAQESGYDNTYYPPQSHDYIADALAYISPEALKAVGKMSEIFESSRGTFQYTQEQLRQLDAAVKEYTDTHPLKVGSTQRVQEKDGRISYASSPTDQPVAELFYAAQATPDTDPLMLGLLAKKANDESDEVARIINASKEQPPAPDSAPTHQSTSDKIGNGGE